MGTKKGPKRHPKGALLGGFCEQSLKMETCVWTAPVCTDCISASPVERSRRPKRRRKRDSEKKRLYGNNGFIEHLHLPCQGAAEQRSQPRASTAPSVDTYVPRRCTASLGSVTALVRVHDCALVAVGARSALSPQVAHVRLIVGGLVERQIDAGSRAAASAQRMGAAHVSEGRARGLMWSWLCMST